MPKQFKTYTRFEGGLNTKTNARSIQDNELAQANNVIVDEFGVIKSCGKAANNDTDYTDPNVTAMQPGYGLFQSTFDYASGGGNSSTVRTFLANADDTTNAVVHVLDATTWDTNDISLGAVTGSEQAKVIYHIADGDVRVCDTNVANTSTDIKKYGYVSAQSRWKDSSGSVQTPGGYAGVLGWISSSVNLAKPDKGLVGITIGGNEDTEAASGNATTLVSDSSSFPSSMDTDFDLGTGSSVNDYWGVNRTNGQFAAITDSSSTADTTLTTATISGSGTWAGNKVFAIYPPAGRGLNLNVVASSGGAWDAGDYEFGITFVYEGNQESLIYQLKGDAVTVSANQKLTCTILATQYKDQGSGAVEYDRRITGGRVYTRISGSDDAWTLFSDVSFTLGARPSLEGGYTYWTEEYSDAPFLYSSFVSSSLNLDTYESINGFSPDSAFIALQGSEKYQTSVVTNRRAFIANVKYTDAEGKLASRGDTIRYSEINKFDTFPEFNFIDIGVNDGEEFIKLEAFADRLFAYKEKTLYIINIGGGSDTQWFLESEHKNMGVEFHAATVKTDFGIAWVNKNGLFFYDGSQIRNLQTKILESQWSGFVNSDTMIGYEPTHKHLVVIRDADDESGDNGDAYVYSFITNSFTFVEDLVADSNKTNPITDAYNKLTMGTGTAEIVSYDGEPDDHTTFDIKLKDDDFGMPNIVKKIYGVTVEYSTNENSTNGVKFEYINDSGNKVSSTNLGTLSGTSDTITVNKFAISTPVLASSFQVQLDLGGNCDHTVNNVAVEYRPIYKRVT